MTRPKECGEAIWTERDWLERQAEKAASRAEGLLPLEQSPFAFPRRLIRINWARTKKHG